MLLFMSIKVHFPGRIQKDLPVASQGRNGAGKFAQAPPCELRGRWFSERAKPRPGATSKALRCACWRAQLALVSPHPQSRSCQSRSQWAKTLKKLDGIGQVPEEGIRAPWSVPIPPTHETEQLGPGLGQGAAGGYLAPPASQAAVDSRPDLPGHSLPETLRPRSPWGPSCSLPP